MENLSEPLTMLTADPKDYAIEMMKRLNILRRDERFCDVTVDVKSKQFAAHKPVLAAASPFFLALLESNMKETKNAAIAMKLEETTTSVMEDVLEYMYTGTVTITEESAHNLITTADYLLMPSLKALSVEFLRENLSIENCIFTYYFAERYHCEELMLESLEHINSNFTAVMATDGFLELSNKQVTELISSDDIVVDSEEEVFEGILKWVSQNRREREGDFTGLFRQVRLISVSRDNLLGNMVKEELVKQNIVCLNVVLDAMKWIANATDEDVPQSPRKCLETHTDAILSCDGSLMLCYVPEQNMYSWYKLQNTLFNHHDHCITQYRGRVYIIGDTDSSYYRSRSSLNNALEYYIPSDNSRVAVEGPLSQARFASFTVLDRYLYTSSPNSSADTIVRRYDPVNRAWTDLVNPPIKRGNACAVADGKHLYLIGGVDGKSRARATTERFDPFAGSWEEVAPINEARYNAFGAATNGKIYLAGGQPKESEGTNTCEVYSTESNQWQLIASLLLPRWSGSMVCVKGALYVLGGVTFNTGLGTPTSSGVNQLSVEKYDPQRNSWRKTAQTPISCENLEGRIKENPFKACCVRIHNKVIDSLKPM